MESVSILRVKRKRTAAASPLDGFVLEPTAAPRATKRQRVFRFAETVPFDSFASVEQTHALHQRIHALTAQPELPSSQPADDAPVSAQSALYRVMPQHTQSGSLKILDVEQQAQERQKRKVSRAPKVTARRSTEEASNEMEQFVPMLKEYLSLREDEPLSNSDVFHSLPSTSATTPPTTTDESDFVYDVYYYSLAPLQSTGSLSRLGALTGIEAEELLLSPGEGDSEEEEAGDEADEDSNEEDATGNEYPSSESDHRSVESGGSERDPDGWDDSD